FPNFQSALKLAVNATLYRNHRSDTGTAVAATVRSCRWIFSSLVQRGIYRLADVEPSDIADLVDQVSKTSWPGVLQQRRRFAGLYLQIRRAPLLARLYAGKSDRAETFTVDLDALERQLGTPIGDQTVPPSFRRHLARLVGDSRPTEKAYEPPAPSR